MKLTVKHYDKKISVKVERDDLTFAEVVELFEHLAMGMGFTQEIIDKYYEK